MNDNTPIDGGTGVERTYAIHEVFYGDDGNPTLWTPVTVMSETVDGLRSTLQQMLECLDKGLTPVELHIFAQYIMVCADEMEGRS